MVKAATDAFSNVDLILFVVDSSRKIGPGDRRIMEDLRGSKTPIVLVINKIDQIEDKDELFDIIKMYDDEKMFKEIVPISALKGKNVKTLINVIKEDLEEGPKYFPDYMVTDQPERVLIAELIREKSSSLCWWRGTTWGSSWDRKNEG